MKYIIQQGIQLENPENTNTKANIDSNAYLNRNIDVLTKEQIKAYQQDGYKYMKIIYQMISGLIRYEVTCVEIWKKGEKEHSLIIPAFLVPHRIYPAYVYAFAINKYSANPLLSQRDVAEMTRNMFNLKTFAHTTLGRAMKALTKALKEIGIGSDDEEATGVAKQSKSIACTKQTQRFSSVQATKAQRKTVNSFSCNTLKDDCDYIHLLAYAFIRSFMDLHQA